ncbi:MAG: protein kinase [Elusimicrobiota bacterium]
MLSLLAALMFAAPVWADEFDQPPPQEPGVIRPRHRTRPDFRATEPRNGPHRSQQPRLSPGGQALFDQMRREIKSGKQVDFKSYFAQIMEAEARNSRKWIDLLARSAHRSSGGDLVGYTLTLWEQYTLRYTDDPSGYSGLGKASFQAGQYGPSVAQLTRAIALGEASPDNFYQRGLSAERLGDFELAHQDAGTALNLKPGDPAMLSLYKLTDGRISKLYVDLATGDTRKAPEPGAGQEAADGAVSARGHGRAAKTPETPAEDPVRQSAGLTEAAQRYLRVGDVNSALVAARQAAGLNPQNAQALGLMATAFERTGDHESAIQAAGQALLVQPGNASALNTRAWAQSGLKRFSDALDDSGRVLDIDPADPFGFLNKARALGGLGRRDEMLDALNRTASLDPRFAGLREQALQLAPSADTELLFAGLLDGRQAAPAPASSAPKGSRRFLILTTLVLVGGFLIALGLLTAGGTGLTERLTSAFRRRETRPRASLPEGNALAGYQLGRVLASGGMGEVFEAKDTRLDRRVAVKKLRAEIRDNGKERGRFLREAKTVAVLQHPNIVQIHAVVEDGQDIYLVFEFVEGKTLEKVLTERSPMPLSQALFVMKDVCAGLDHAHAQGVIHRDLKPSNIMLDSKGVAKVMDFGVAHHARAAMARATSTRTVWGTPPYMAPEAEEGEIGRESDIYALGVCLYEMLTGDVPFKGAAGAMFAAKSKADFAPASSLRAGLPAGVDALIASALDPDPRKRKPKSAKRFFDELQAAAGKPA